MSLLDAANHPDQTHFSYGKPHYSEGHLRHDGCRSLWQEDLQLRNHQGQELRHWGQPWSGQTNLGMKFPRS